MKLVDSFYEEVVLIKITVKKLRLEKLEKEEAKRERSTCPCVYICVYHIHIDKLYV